jgi:hypothetical protein
MWSRDCIYSPSIPIADSKGGSIQRFVILGFPIEKVALEEALEDKDGS